MYRYYVEFQYKLGTGSHAGSRSVNVEITFPKRVYAFTDCYGNDGKGRNEILTKAVNELGLDPSMVEAIADRSKLDGGWYKLKYLGEVNQNTQSENTSSNISSEDREAHYNATVSANRERREAHEAELDRKLAEEDRKLAEEDRKAAERQRQADLDLQNRILSYDRYEANEKKYRNAWTTRFKYLETIEFINDYSKI